MRKAGALDEGAVTSQELCHRGMQPLESWCYIFLLMTSFGTPTGIPRTRGIGNVGLKRSASWGSEQAQEELGMDWVAGVY